MLGQGLAKVTGIESLAALPKETEAPKAFTYSLFYVFYDQYTYITGILAQNSLLGVAAVIMSLQVSPSNPSHNHFYSFSQ